MEDRLLAQCEEGMSKIRLKDDTGFLQNKILSLRWRERHFTIRWEWEDGSGPRLLGFMDQ